MTFIVQTTLALLLLAHVVAHAETGAARVVKSDRLDGTAQFELSVQPDSGGWHLIATTARPDTRYQDGDRVQVLRSVARAVGPARVAIAPLMTRALATTSAVSGLRRGLVILLDYADKPHTIRTPAGASGAAAAITAYFSAASYGMVTLPLDVVGPYLVPATSAGCDYWGLAQQADAAASAAGVDLSVYLHRVYALPQSGACQFAGLATVGGNPGLAWINGGLSVGITTHELGHTLGLYHSHSLRRPGDARSTMLEYGDTADVLGGGMTGPAHFNAGQKARLGWLTARTVEAGTYTLAPFETTPDALRFARPDGSSLLVEARTQFANYNRKDGVLVHLDAGPDNIYLLDGTPLTSSWSDPALLAGMTFTDAALRIDVTASDLTGATVTIGGSVPPPLFPTTLLAVVGVASLSLAWEPGQPATQTGYVVERALAVGGPFVQLAATTAPAYLNDGLAAGATYCYRVRATNVAGSSPPSSIVCAVPAALPPGAVVLAITGTSPPGRETVVRGTLTGALALTATIDGAPVASKYVTVDRLRRTWAVKLQGLVKGAHAFAVASGAATATMTFTVPK